jgi:hypothetical protein
MNLICICRRACAVGLAIIVKQNLIRMLSIGTNVSMRDLLHGVLDLTRYAGITTAH